MSISSLASSIWSSATTALSTPQPSTVAVSTPASTSTAAAATTGASDPFQQLGQDLQAWLTQLQAAGGSAQSSAASQVSTGTDQTGSSQTASTGATHHRHHHPADGQGTQTDGNEVQQDLSTLVADLKAGQGSSGSVSQALQSYATAGSVGGTTLTLV